jgi:hypothetical protein
MTFGEGIEPPLPNGIAIQIFYLDPSRSASIRRSRSHPKADPHPASQLNRGSPERRLRVLDRVVLHPNHRLKGVAAMWIESWPPRPINRMPEDRQPPPRIRPLEGSPASTRIGSAAVAPATPTSSQVKRSGQAVWLRCVLLLGHRGGGAQRVGIEAMVETEVIAQPVRLIGCGQPPSNRFASRALGGMRTANTQLAAGDTLTRAGEPLSPPRLVGLVSVGGPESAPGIGCAGGGSRQRLA